MSLSAPTAASCASFTEHVQNFVNSPRFRCYNLFPNRKHYEDSMAILLEGNKDGFEYYLDSDFKKNARKNYMVQQINGKPVLVYSKSGRQLLCWEDLEAVLVDYHDNGGHNGRDATIKKIQERFHHVPHHLVNDYIKHCNLCKVRYLPKQDPDMSPLKVLNDSLNDSQQAVMPISIPGDFDIRDVKEECESPADAAALSNSNFGDDAQTNKQDSIGHSSLQFDGNVYDDQGESRPEKMDSHNSTMTNATSRDSRLFKCVNVETLSNPEGSHPSGTGNQNLTDNNFNDQPLPAPATSQPLRTEKNKYGRSSIKQTRLNRQLALCIAGPCELPFEKLSQDDFVKLFQICDHEIYIPQREILEERMNDLISEIKVEVKKRLHAAKLITISVELFERGRFLAALATFYDATQRKKNTLVLAIRKNEGCSYRRLKQDILFEYQLQENSTKSIRFDISTSYHVSLFRELSKYLRNYQTWKESGQRPNLTPCYVETDCHNEDSDDECLLDGNQTHFLQLLLKYAQESYTNLSLLYKIMQGVDNIVETTKDHIPAIVIETLDLDFALSPILNKGPIWKCIYMSLDNILTQRSKLEKLGGHVSDALNDMNWIEAEELLTFLKPFNSYTDLCGKEGPTCVSEIVVIIIQLKTHLKKFQAAKNYKETVTLMLAQLDRQFDHIFNPVCNGQRQYDGLFLASTLLDPRFRKALKIDEVLLAKQYIASRQTDQNSKSSATTTNAKYSYQCQEPLNKKRKYECLNEMEWEDISPLEVEGELESYIHNKSYDTNNDDLNPWKFWQEHETNFPKLTQIALDLLSVPLCMSAEECISLANSNIYRSKENDSDQEFERRILLAWNKSLLNC